MELNPNHGVTNEMREQYHKLLAFCVWKFGSARELTITSTDLAQFVADQPDGINLVVHPIHDVLRLRIVGDVEGAALARKAGGLPS